MLLRPPSIDQIKDVLNFLFIYKFQCIYYVNYAGYVFIIITLFSSPYNVCINSIKIRKHINILLTKKITNIIFNFVSKQQIEQILHNFL